jgi:RNA polymerase sigma-70 factor (ECF subfamily)
MNVVGIDDERALVEAARSGNRPAIERLLRRHQPQIHAVCRRITGSDADALDATQEALIAIVRGLPRFDGRARFSTWAYRIATNASLDELRRRQRRPQPGLDPTDAGPHGGPRTPTTPDPAQQVSDRDELDTALAQLSPEFRAVVVLRDLLALDYAEIAEVLDLPPGTVRSRIARGRAQLADHLRGNRTPPPERPSTEP